MYYATKTKTAWGTMHEFHGPGMPRHANGVHFLQSAPDWVERYAGERERHDVEAETVSRMLALAYEAGRQAAKQEVRDVLGVK